MKKNTIIAALAAASAIFLCASCQKQEIPAPNNTGVKVFTATINQNLTKTTIDSSYKVSWVDGDKVNINGVEYSATVNEFNSTKATLTAVGEGATLINEKYAAIYPSTLYVTDHFEIPAIQTYAAGQFNAPMYAESDTVAFEFKNICGVLCFSLTGTDKVKSISVTANEPICGTFSMTNATTINFTGEGKTVTLDCGSTGVQLNETTATNFYIYLPPKASYTAGMKIVATSTGDKVFEKTTSTAINIEKNNLYTFDWAATFTAPGQALPAGALEGVFSVSGTKKVHFSKGNLTYNVSAKKWAFYGHQYDCATGYDSNLISLFTWGYDAAKSIVPAGSSYVEGHTADGETFNKTEDWGYVFGGESSVWRTLTKDEWQYLFDNHSYKWVTVNSVNGYVIAPDGFTGNLAASYTDDAALAKDKLVFLPAAGTRGGMTHFEIGDWGFYWTSSASIDSYAYQVMFYSNAVTLFCDGRGSGLSIRLVTEDVQQYLESPKLGNEWSWE